MHMDHVISQTYLSRPIVYKRAKWQMLKSQSQERILAIVTHLIFWSRRWLDAANYE